MQNCEEILKNNMFVQKKNTFLLTINIVLEEIRNGN